MVLVRRPGSTPRLTVALACGSRSMRRTRRLLTARQAARLTAVVVFPHPPFWFTRASRRAVGLLSPSTASLPTTRALVHIRRGHRPRPPRTSSLTSTYIYPKLLPLPPHFLSLGSPPPRLSRGRPGGPPRGAVVLRPA